MNLERLMTRLAGGMPYDWRKGHVGLLAALLKALKDSLSKRIETAKSNVNWERLRYLAMHCQRHQISCITFNYDDIFDRALSETPGGPAGGKWWPTWGYGFYCPHSFKAVGIDAAIHLSEVTTTTLLKLHGSMNWRTLHGTPSPCGVNSISHFEEWSNVVCLPPDSEKRRQVSEFAELYLDPEPFIVPPVLTKTELVAQPILRVIWSTAPDLLKSAESITFVGYSLPLTDIAARTLFREGLSKIDNANVKIVDYAQGNAGKDKLAQLYEAYSDLFPKLDSRQINLDGAAKWAEAIASR
jgi:hypothetical protein